MNQISGTYCTSEAKRIGFLLQRDGLEKTQAFARQTFKVYLKAIEIDTGHLAQRDERSPVADSLLELSHFLGEAETRVLLSPDAPLDVVAHLQGLRVHPLDRNLVPQGLTIHGEVDATLRAALEMTARAHGRELRFA